MDDFNISGCHRTGRTRLLIATTLVVFLSLVYLPQESITSSKHFLVDWKSSSRRDSSGSGFATIPTIQPKIRIRRKCGSKVHVRNGYIVSLEEKHNHVDDTEKIIEYSAREKIRKRVTEEPMESIKKIYKDECQNIAMNISSECAAKFPPLSSMIKSLYAERKKRFPKGLPKPKKSEPKSPTRIRIRTKKKAKRDRGHLDFPLSFFNIGETPHTSYYYQNTTMPQRKDTTSLLSQLRSLMSNGLEPVDAYIVPSEDAHFSEYAAECFDRRAFLTGFTGSSGVAVVTQQEALLWTDGRYFIQALEQIDENWVLMKQGLPDTPSQAKWLNKNLPEGSKVGVDPTLYSQDEWDNMSKELKLAGKILTAVETNLVDLIWTERPARPQNAVEILELQYAGKSTAAKINEIRKEMADAGCEFLLVTQLDEIAWLLNLRGTDVPYNPVFYSNVLLTPTGFEVFVDQAKLKQDVKATLADSNGNVAFFAYESVFERLRYYVSKTTGRIWCSNKCNYALVKLIPEDRRYVKLTPISLMKATKNSIEVQGMINSHIRDGAALCQYFAWLESVVGKQRVTEISAAQELLGFRAAQKHFRGMSFPSISSSGPNGAIIHYNPTMETDRELSTSEVYLIDSGGQYLDGTTDVTRTLHFGTPTDFQKDCFTRVLKGSIALKTATFPNKVVGNTLDTLARKFLWDVGLDYIHGTGHGIGAFLNVHEGPHGISWRHLPDDPGLRENMFVSNEPGYYHEGSFGIRIENIIRIVPVTLTHNFANRGYLGFEDVTFVPIQQKMIKHELLTRAEVNYLNEYHNQCRERVGKYMLENNIGEAGVKWLWKETEPIQYVEKD